MTKNVLILVMGVLLFWSSPTEAKKRKKKTKRVMAMKISQDEKSLFKDKFQEKIDKVKTPKDKLMLAIALLEASKEYNGGVKYLILNNAYKLIAKSRDVTYKQRILESMQTLEGIDKKSILTKLLKVQLKGIEKIKSDLKKKKQNYLVSKDYYIMSNAVVDNAIELCQICLNRLDFKGAGNAVKQGLKISTKIYSTKTPLLRWYQRVGNEIAAKYNSAKSQKKKDPDAAAWGFIEAGAYKQAAKLITDKSDADLKLLLKVGIDQNLDQEIIFKAATLWANKANLLKGKSKELAIYRAIQLYKKCLSPKFKKNDLAASKLAFLQKELDTKLEALRKASEWVRLTDLPVASASVGYGKFEVVKPVKCPFGIAGKLFASGFKAHANSKIVFHLNGKYKNFIGSCGLCSGAGGKAYFKILCDNKEVFKSPYLWNNSGKFIKKPIKLKIKGVDKLELISESDCIAGSFSAWGDVRVK